MSNAPIHPYQRSSVGESSSAATGDAGGDTDTSMSNDSLANTIKLPTKAARRIRGEIACAECRRLKIRCDKTVPCSTCIKRGCSALCPNGTIPPGEGSRFVLAATDHLRQKLTKLEARMRSLEDALAIIHAPHSDEPHPLLARTSDDLYEDDKDVLTATQGPKRTSPGLGDPLGTLCVDEQGGSRFFGPSGGSESLLMSKGMDSAPSDQSGPATRELDPSYLPPAINQCYQSFPFTPPNVDANAVQLAIESFLPNLERAIALCDIFVENLSWMFNIVSRTKLVNELIPLIYKQIPGHYGPHDLGVLFVVLGMGCLVDLTLLPYDLEAQHYYRLARATLALQPVLGEQSVTTIKVSLNTFRQYYTFEHLPQVLHLMSVYNGMSGKESNLEQSYALLDLAGQLAMKIGLRMLYFTGDKTFSVKSTIDVDPSSWGFQGREAYERRVYFWNLMSAVLWQSLATGRPPTLLTSYIDCRTPTIEDENTFHQGEFPAGFGIWGYRANSECLMPLARATLAVKSPDYETILELDRKIRDLSTPRADITQSHTQQTAISMRIFVRSHYQELMLLFLHRAYFAQAMSEYPADPLNSPYGYSVTAAFKSACIVLQDTRAQFLRKPLLCSRVWRIWSFTFSAAIIVGTVAIRGTHLGLEPPALEEFEAICKVFCSAADSSNRAARALPILQVMLQKAHLAQQRYQSQGKSDSHECIDELSFLSGQSRVIKPSAGNPSNSPRGPIPFETPTSATHPRNHSSPSGHPPHRFNSFVQMAPPSQQQLPLPPSFSIGGQHLHQAFGHLTGGWNGNHAGAAGFQYNIPSQVDERNAGNGAPTQQHLGQPHERLRQQPANNTVIGEDRWSSFMNYGMMGSNPPQGRPMRE